MGLGEHLGALVDADDGAGLLADELTRDRARPRRDVEHAIARCGLDPRHEKPPPAWILAVGERGGVALVGRSERGKELPRVLGPLRRDDHVERVYGGAR